MLASVPLTSQLVGPTAAGESTSPIDDTAEWTFQFTAEQELDVICSQGRLVIVPECVGL